uniref:Uncharacterized protein n=1 Tax=Lepeophtheirus salmonis TaxID=72036 RepID=A0A0K2UVC3_LEPSM
MYIIRIRLLTDDKETIYDKGSKEYINIIIMRWLEVIAVQSCISVQKIYQVRSLMIVQRADSLKDQSQRLIVPVLRTDTTLL